MNEKARLAIEHLVTTLDRFVPPDQPGGCFKAEAMKLKAGEDKRLKEFFVNTQMLSVGMNALKESTRQNTSGAEYPHSIPDQQRAKVLATAVIDSKCEGGL